ncbi:enoyl-CoA hydratase [Gammaproteobacteria bacterium 42_54_T18]|nr:enoyl-CoA hydratase [Gammaproteobacteria bacterium 42_54_T18]
MAYNTIDYKINSNVLTLTLNRPDNLNSFTVEMANELIDAFNAASNDDVVRAIVVTGAGRAFCAGMDLSAEGNVFGLDENQVPTLDDMNNRLDDPAILHGVRDTGGRVTLAIYDCTKPVIAAINGAAVGIGATMTLAMDIRLASEKARIGFVFNKLGIVPEACSSWFLPKIVGISQALEWVYSAEIIKPEAAKEARLVKAVYPAETLLEEAYKIANKIANNTSAVAIAMSRQMMYRNSAQPHPIEAHKIESLAMFYASVDDGKEGVNAFFEKREAKFSTTMSENKPPFYPWW